ncbi:MAG: CotH kinase family protein [Dokdonella sp.]|nr:CotH kinase family protein [Dokdonella sp.]
MKVHLLLGTICKLGIVAGAGIASVQAALPVRINDSGQTRCYAGAGDTTVVVTACSNTQWPGQDGASGRDAGGVTKLGGGAAGFDFSKIANNGSELPAGAAPGSAPTDWGCTRDNVTGLLWRIVPDTNLSWSGAQVAARGLAAGASCGRSDWRLPDHHELLGIVHYGANSPALDGNYFPALAAGFHWTREADPTAPPQRARVVNLIGGFVHGIDAVEAADALYVSGGNYHGAPVRNPDGSVSDPHTGLQWDACALGQDAANQCNGTALSYNWQNALKEVRTRNQQNWHGHGDWRLPNVKELASLIEIGSAWPALDATTSPNAPPTAHWSSTTDDKVWRMAWAAFFGTGNVFAKDKATTAALRLVRTATAAATGTARDGLFEDGFDLVALPPAPAAAALALVSVVTDGGVPIDRNNYVTGSMVITRSDGSVDYAGTLQIRGRGNSTWNMPKKPYRIKLDAKSKLLGMNSSKHWALLANYADKSLLRNSIALSLGQDMAMAWSPDSRMVRAELNGQYIGIYQLIETIRVDSDRVDITEIEPGDVALPEVSGGYLFEIDKRRDCAANVLLETTRHVPICIDTPDEDAIVPQQYAWIGSYIQGMEDALYAPDFADPAQGYRAWLNPDSFIDWYLVNELTANVDAADFSSIWNYKDRNGLIERGPLWDFDLGTGNANYCACANPQGWWVHGGTWYERLFADPWFAARVRARWDALKPGLLDSLPQRIDQLAAPLRGAVDANFNRWPLLDGYTWPNVIVTGSWQGELAYNRDWLRQRIDWLDANL